MQVNKCLSLSNGFFCTIHITEIFLKKADDFNISIDNFPFKIFSNKSNSMHKIGTEFSEKITVSLRVKMTLFSLRMILILFDINKDIPLKDRESTLIKC